MGASFALPLVGFNLFRESEAMLLGTHPKSLRELGVRGPGHSPPSGLPNRKRRVQVHARVGECLIEWTTDALPPNQHSGTLGCKSYAMDPIRSASNQ